jgi:hypothetical protein
LERNVFKTVSIGVCSYFLILYSCLKIFEKLWFSSAPDSFAAFSTRFIIYILMLPAGIFLFRRYRKALVSHPDNEKLLASTAAKFIGGCVILADGLKVLVPSYLFSIFVGHINQDTFLLFLIPIAVYLPAFIAAVVMIRSGSLKKDGLESPERIAFLCFRVVLIYIFISCIHQILVWLGPAFRMHSFSSVEIKWISIELAFVAAVLLLFFSPLHLKTEIRKDDMQVFVNLSRRSFELGGWLILINGISYFCSYLIRNFEYLVTASGEFGYEDRLTGFIPSAFLLAVSLSCIRYGMKYYNGLSNYDEEK